jgi:hypothetical protein
MVRYDLILKLRERAENLDLSLAGREYLKI